MLTDGMKLAFELFEILIYDIKYDHSINHQIMFVDQTLTDSIYKLFIINVIIENDEILLPAKTSDVITVIAHSPLLRAMQFLLRLCSNFQQPVTIRHRWGGQIIQGVGEQSNEFGEVFRCTF